MTIENWNDKEFVLERVKRDGWDLNWDLKYASEELRNDKEVVLEAVKQNGFALYYASEELRNDKEVMLVPVKLDSGDLEITNYLKLRLLQEMQKK